LVDGVVHLSDFYFHEAEAQQMCDLESTKAMEGEVVVCGAVRPAASEDVRDVVVVWRLSLRGWFRHDSGADSTLE
jgi:hypothetical protein